MNIAIIVGNMGRDPEMRFTPGGTAVTSFSVATSRYIGTGEQRREETEWHNVVTFDKLAQNVNELGAKGRKVAITGRIQTRSWDDQQTGTKKYRTEIIANTVEFVGPRPGANGNGNGGANGHADRELDLDDDSLTAGMGAAVATAMAGALPDDSVF